MLTDDERAILTELTGGSIGTARAWWRDGLTGKLQALQQRGLVDCLERDGSPGDPMDLDVISHWQITEAGREALN